MLVSWIEQSSTVPERDHAAADEVMGWTKQEVEGTLSWVNKAGRVEMAVRGRGFAPSVCPKHFELLEGKLVESGLYPAYLRKLVELVAPGRRAYIDRSSVQMDMSTLALLLGVPLVVKVKAALLAAALEPVGV